MTATERGVIYHGTDWWNFAYDGGAGWTGWAWTYCAEPLCNLRIVVPKSVFDKIANRQIPFCCPAGHRQQRSFTPPTPAEIAEAREESYRDGFEDGRREAELDTGALESLVAELRGIGTAGLGDVRSAVEEAASLLGQVRRGEFTLVRIGAVPGVGAEELEEPPATAGDDGTVSPADAPEATPREWVRGPYDRCPDCGDEIRSGTLKGLLAHKRTSAKHSDTKPALKTRAEEPAAEPEPPAPKPCERYNEVCLTHHDRWPCRSGEEPELGQEIADTAWPDAEPGTCRVCLVPIRDGEEATEDGKTHACCV